MGRRWRDFLAGLFILAVGPAVVIGGLWGWAGYQADQQQPGPLTVQLDRTMAFLDQPVGVHFVSGDRVPERGDKPPPPPMPVDLVALIDVSGSTTTNRVTLIRAVEEASRSLLLSGGAPNRVSVISFGTEARVHVKWTSSYDDVLRGVRELEKLDGGNDSRAMFREIDNMLATARPFARRVLVYYTDGYWVSCQGSVCPNPPMDWPEVIPAAQALNGRGIESYVVAIPGDFDAEHMVQVAGSPGRLLTSDNQADITRNFQKVVQNVVATDANILAPHGQLTVPIDGRLFQAETTDSGWSVNVLDHRLTREIQPLLRAKTQFSVDVRPQCLGLVPLTAERPVLRYLNPDGVTPVGETVETSPVLVLSPWFLLIAFLPALLWTLAHLWHRKPKELPPEKIAERLPLPPVAPRILQLPSAATITDSAVPTLLIGIGGWGNRVVADFRQHVLSTQDTTAGPPPFHFVGIDLDTRTPLKDAGTELPADVMTPSDDVKDANLWLHQIAPNSGPYAGLPLINYRHVSRQELSLLHGCHGDRVLGRAALLRWFETGELAPQLATALRGLMAHPTSDGVTQIVLFAHAEGGFGSAAALDIARVLRRTARRGQSPGTLIPEIICVAGQGGHKRDERARLNAFLAEIDTTRDFGRQPRRVTLAVNDPLLDQTDDESPFDTLLSLDGDPEDITSEAVVAAEILTDPSPRRALLPAITRTAGFHAVVSAKSLVSRGETLRRMVFQELLLRLFGRWLLGGVEPDPYGAGYRTPEVQADHISAVLDRLAMADSGDTPWSKLVRGIQVPSRLPEMITMLASHKEDWHDWLARLAARSMTAAFMPSASAPSPRPITPPEMVAALDRIVTCLNGAIRIELNRLAAPPDVVAAIQALAGRLETLGKAMGMWVTALTAATADAAADKIRLRSTAAMGGRAIFTLDNAADDVTVGRWLDHVFRTWMREQADNDDDLRAHLGFAVIADNLELIPVLRCKIGGRDEFRVPAHAITELRRILEPISGLVRHLTIDEVLSDANRTTWTALSDDLGCNAGSQDGTILVIPKPMAEIASEALANIVRKAINTAGGSPILVEVGRCRAALTRLVWSRPRRGRILDIALPLVQPTDIVAEDLRRRLAQYLDRVVDVLPSGLAIAAGNLDRFQTFGRLYRSGNLRLMRNIWHRTSWVLGPSNIFLTDGSVSLADAAATFVSRDIDPGAVRNGPAGGDFSLLAQWRQSRHDLEPQDEELLLVLAAITLTEETQAWWR